MIKSIDAMNEQRFIQLAMEAGFEPYESHKLSGATALDESIYVQEYPCGENLKLFGQLLIDEINAPNTDMLEQLTGPIGGSQ